MRKSGTSPGAADAFGGADADLNVGDIVGMLFAIFGDCNLDGKSRTLRRKGRVIHLTPKAFELLTLLLERHPAVVSKQDIMEHLWPGTFVSEANIPNLIAEIREASGDSADEPRYIRTVHRLGYAFCAKVNVVNEDAKTTDEPSLFSLIIDGREMRLIEGDNIVGRGESCQVVVNSSTVSRRHTRIRVGRNVALVSDLKSKNGTYVGGARVHGLFHIRDGDEIQIGEVKMTFRQLDRTRPTKTYLPSGDNPAKKRDAQETKS
ncbi:MAG: winged helix-turn-helix domain-containing protein [Vicinamibacteria bacterium]|nr:winged helix-turn-helix domain-containing protein [Vicinamibacteria bacterium]